MITSKEKLSAFCNDHGFECKWVTIDFVDYVELYKPYGISFVEAASWQENFKKVIPTFFPKSEMMLGKKKFGYPDDSNVVIFKIGSIVDILKS